MPVDPSDEQLSFFDNSSKSPGGETQRIRWIDEGVVTRPGPGSFESYDALVETARACNRCGLREGCRQVVVGEGSTQADIMFVGEGPGGDEDRLGRPFVGRAGQLLDRILEAAGLVREEVYITNVVLCRPPGNRTPTLDEIQTCLTYLNGHIELVRPRLLVAMGSTAVRGMIGPGARITRLRGRWHEYLGVPVMPTFHPAALLRDPGKKRPVWQDIQQLMAKYSQLQ